jgi:thiamine-phosphate pyrophosphorylase
MMNDQYTAGALRALERAQARARHRGSEHVGPGDLLAALADESESRAAVLLAEAGLEPPVILAILGADDAVPPSDPRSAPLPSSPEVRDALSEAGAQARALDRSRSVGTEHLLGGLLSLPGAVSELLDAAGFAVAPLLDRLNADATAETAPIPMAAEIPPLQLTDATETVDIFRVLDASANRAREGLRVVEDYARFALDDPGLTRRLKDVRHRLAEAVRGLDLDALTAARDTRGDVGTSIMAADERVRDNPRAVLIANFKRASEALRSLEEYAKLIDVWLAGRFEVLRYDVYTLEKLTLSAVAAHRTLADARLMVLVGGLPTLGDLTWVVGEALAGGADVIQLREKALPDREWLQRAREVRILTAQAHARFVLNDRPDLARLASADGVHLGQHDMTPRDARRIVGPRMVIGVSTHDREQLDHAIVAGAGYLGVGPVFPSETKDFSDLAGLAFVTRAAETTNLPWFAIGGINETNVDRVLEAGATRIAVSAAIVHAARPRDAAATLRARLLANAPEPS